MTRLEKFSREKHAYWVVIWILDCFFSHSFFVCLRVLRHMNMLLQWEQWARHPQEHPWMKNSQLCCILPQGPQQLASVVEVLWVCSTRGLGALLLGFLLIIRYYFFMVFLCSLYLVMYIFYKMQNHMVPRYHVCLWGPSLYLWIVQLKVEKRDTTDRLNKQIKYYCQTYRSDKFNPIYES